MTAEEEHLATVMGFLDEAWNGKKPKDATDASWRKTGLVLFLFPYGDSKIANYISNGADRSDMVKFLRETADRFEADLRAKDQRTEDQINQAAVMHTVRETVEAGISDIAEVEKKLADDGRLVEAGWQGFKRLVLSPTAGDAQVAMMRLGFMSGAHHLFSTVISIMDEDTEPSAEDLQRMDKINRELNTFSATEMRRYKRPE